MTTRERRIYKHWNSCLKTWDRRRESIGELRKWCATYWKMSVRQWRVIVDTEKELG